MTPYCSIQDLRTAQPEIRLIEATDDAHPNETGDFDTGIAQEVIELSAGIIDGFLADRYALPLPVVPAILRKISVDLTLHGLYERIGRAGEGSEMDGRYKRVMAMLKLIGDGKLSLGLDAATAETVQTVSVGMSVSGGTPEFTERSMDSLGGGFQRCFP